MGKFKSRQSIVNWLNQRKVIAFKEQGFIFFYKLIKGRLYTYSKFHKRWNACYYEELINFFQATNNWYKSKHLEIHW